MESFIKKVITMNNDSTSRRYFLRFGKGDYKGRFLLFFDRSKARLKIGGSFEFANDFVNFVNGLGKNLKFTGKIFMKDKVPGKEGRKKAGVFSYDVEECEIKEFENAYYYLLDVNNEEILLRIKKSLPKPGQDESKIDEKFCLLELDLSYWETVKSAFFWDVPECKKATVEHEIKVDTIEMPKGEKDPVKIREMAVRKGKILRKITTEGKDIINEYDLKV